MKLGIVIGTNEPEVVWNAFRFACTSLKENHEVKVFLINKGVEAEEKLAGDCSGIEEGKENQRS